MKALFMYNNLSTCLDTNFIDDKGTDMQSYVEEYVFNFSQQVMKFHVNNTFFYLRCLY